MTTKILIIGATGNISRLTAAALTAQYPKLQLRLTSSREDGLKLLRETFPAAEVVQADWYKEASLLAAMRGVDKVMVITPDFVTDESIATPNVIRAAKAAGNIQQIVRLIAMPPGFTSSRLTPAQLATRCGAALHSVAKPLLDGSGLPITYINVACWIMFNLAWFMAQDVKKSRRMSMPAISDTPRPWLAEQDIADVFARVLADDAARHVGRNYLITGQRRYTYPQVAAVIGDVIGEKVVYNDDDTSLREAMGPLFDTLMTYYTQETPCWAEMPTTRTFEELLGRPAMTLEQYVAQNKSLFI